MPTRRRKTQPRTQVQKLPPTDPEARDEGPRLIPLPDDLDSPPGTRRQLELADRLLANERARRPKLR